MRSPDKICEIYASENIKITCKVRRDFVLIEGNKKTLEFLGNLILAQAKFREDCSFEISPSGAGKIFFARGSKKGFYIHCLPCKRKNKKR